MSSFQDENLIQREAVTMFADIVGYSKLSERDEYLCLQLLGEYRSVFRQIIPIYNGKEIDTIGDGFLIEFVSAIDAVQCAVSLQSAIHKRNLSVSEEYNFDVRIGMHIGKIIDVEDSIFGNSVNIASRIESVARPRGICISEAVYEEIKEKIPIKVKKRGYEKFKNIKDKKLIYDLLPTWKKDLKRKGKQSNNKAEGFLHTFSRNPGNNNLDGLTLLIIGVFAFILLIPPLVIGFVSYGANNITGGRNPASAQKSQRVDLSQGWKYIVDNTNERTEKFPNENLSGWKNFSTLKGFKWTEDNGGAYWLKKEFEIKEDSNFVTPSIVLGIIDEKSKVYLNNVFIGGSNHRYNVAKYSFSPELLKKSEKNTILIRAETKARLYVGLRQVPRVEMYLGEFDDVYAGLVSHWFDFHVMRFSLLLFVILSGLASLTYFFLYPTSKHALYFGIFLIVNGASMSYYNLFVAQNLSGTHHKLLQILGYILSSTLLFSAFLAVRRRNYLETINNIVTILWCLTAVFLLNFLDLSSEKFRTAYHLLLTSAFLYTTYWLGYVYFKFGKSYSGNFKFGQKPGRILKITNSGILLPIFGIIILFAIAESLGLGDNLPLIKKMDAILIIHNLKAFYPVFFSLALIVIIVGGSAKKNKRSEYYKLRDDEIKNIMHKLSQQSSIENAGQSVLKSASQFVQAERATLYLIPKKDEKNYCLKLCLSHSDVGEMSQFLRKEIEPDSSLLGYVFRSRVPFFTNDIFNDYRFQKEIQTSNTTSYKTNGCMLIPLIMGSHLEGIITFADKRDNKLFDKDDFDFARLIAAKFALMSSAARIASVLEKEDIEKTRIHILPYCAELSHWMFY